MANPEHLKILKQGVESWNAWRTGSSDGAHLDGADLQRAHLTGADLTSAHLKRANLAEAFLNGAALTGAHLKWADLTRADLRQANLASADLQAADLAGANLIRANLRGASLAAATLFKTNLAGADLAGANLRMADLTGASLDRANLTGAHLDGANLAGARMAGTLLGDLDLSDVSGLQDVIHSGLAAPCLDTSPRQAQSPADQAVYGRARGVVDGGREGARRGPCWWLEPQRSGSPAPRWGYEGQANSGKTASGSRQGITTLALGRRADENVV